MFRCSHLPIRSLVTLLLATLGVLTFDSLSVGHAQITTATSSATDSVATSSASTTSPTGAETDQAQALQEERTARVNDARAALPTADSATAVLDERARKRLTNLAANMSNRTEAATARFANIADRLERRAAKLDRTGADTTVARRAIEAARIHLDSAEAAMASIDSDVYQFVYSPRPAESWPEVHLLYQTAQEALTSCQIALRIALGELRAAVPTTPATPADANIIN